MIYRTYYHNNITMGELSPRDLVVLLLREMKDYLHKSDDRLNLYINNGYISYQTEKMTRTLDLSHWKFVSGNNVIILETVNDERQKLLLTKKTGKSKYLIIKVLDPKTAFATPIGELIKGN